MSKKSWAMGIMDITELSPRENSKFDSPNNHPR